MATSSDPPDGPDPAASPRGLRGLIESVLPRERFADQRDILSGTGQNAVGLIIAVVATFATQVLITRALGAAAFGLVTLATQVTFVGSFATRFGMDMAAVRVVAIEMGAGREGRIRGVVRRAAAIAAVVSVAVAVVTFVLARPIADRLNVQSGLGARTAFRAAALGLPFAALTQVYLAGTRGLKKMRQTLYIFYAGQPTIWIVLMLAGWVVSKTAGVSTLAYTGSWAVATILAWVAWERESAPFASHRAEDPAGETRALLRFGAPRAPAALLSQALFWADLYVLARYASAADVGVYSAAVRAAQALVLFLTSVSLIFSPFVADLHARGERVKLDRLFKTVTRWTMALTLPVLLLLVILPGPVLKIFGGEFGQGREALLILIVGQFVNVSVGSVGFILIMVGRTGWDLTVYAASFVLDVVVAAMLAPRLGMKGAAIAQTVTLIVANAGRLYLVKRFVGIWPFDRHFLRLAVPAAVGAAVMAAGHAALSAKAWPVDLGGSLVVGWAAYGIVLILAGLTAGERAVVRSLLGRGAGRAGHRTP